MDKQVIGAPLPTTTSQKISDLVEQELPERVLACKAQSLEAMRRSGLISAEALEASLRL